MGKSVTSFMLHRQDGDWLIGDDSFACCLCFDKLFGLKQDVNKVFVAVYNFPVRDGVEIQIQETDDEGIMCFNYLRAGIYTRLRKMYWQIKDQFPTGKYYVRVIGYA